MQKVFSRPSVVVAMAALSTEVGRAKANYTMLENGTEIWAVNINDRVYAAERPTGGIDTPDGFLYYEVVK